MKKTWATGAVVALHGVMVGALVLTAGCGTTGQTPPPQEPMPMPPVVEPPPPVLPPPPKVVVPPPVEMTKTYTVKSGDSISLIAQRFKVTKADLLKLNKITNPDKIKVGQKLKLPSYVDLNAPAPVRKASHKAAAPKAGKATGGDYTVVSGDTLGGIAYRHGTTVAAIKQANALTSDRIHIGQKLAMPKGASKPAAGGAVQEPAAATGEGVPGPVVEPDVTAAGGTAPGGTIEPPKPNEVLHVVEPNQDLTSIAMMYGVRAEEILRLNNLTSPEVKVGQTLKIPPPVE